MTFDDFPLMKCELLLFNTKQLQTKQLGTSNLNS